MTVSTTEVSASYTGNGATTAFSFPYLFLADAHLVVTVDGVVQALNSDYTVAGAKDPNGGTVTFSAAPAAGTAIVLRRSTAVLQPLDLVANDRFPAEPAERAWDRLTLIAQEQDTRLGGAEDRLDGAETRLDDVEDESDRALKRPPGEDHYDAEGRRIENLAEPTANQHAATRQYVDERVSSDASGGAEALRADLADSGEDKGAGLVFGVRNIMPVKGLVSDDPEAGSANFTLLESAVAAAGSRSIIELPSDDRDYWFGETSSNRLNVIGVRGFVGHGGAGDSPNGTRLFNLTLRCFDDLLLQRVSLWRDLVDDGSQPFYQLAGSNLTLEDCFGNRDFSVEGIEGLDIAFSVFLQRDYQSKKTHNLRIIGGGGNNGSRDFCNFFGNLEGLYVTGLRGKAGDDGIVLKGIDGSIKRVVVSDCEYIAASGLAIVQVDEGNIIEDVCYSNCVLESTAPVSLRLRDTSGDQFKGGAARNIHISDLVCKSNGDSEDNPPSVRSFNDKVTDRLLFFEARDGSVLENVSVSNIRLDGPARAAGTQSVILFRCRDVGSKIDNVEIDGVRVNVESLGANGEKWDTIIETDLAGGSGGDISSISLDNFTYSGAVGGCSQLLRNRHPIKGLQLGKITNRNSDSPSDALTVTPSSGDGVEVSFLSPLDISGENAGQSPGNTVQNWGKLRSQNSEQLFIGTLEGDSEHVLLSVRSRIWVSSVEITATDDVPQDDTDYVRFRVRRDNPGPANLAPAVTTEPGGLEIVSRVPTRLHGAKYLNSILEPGSVLYLDKTDFGAGQVIPQVTVSVFYTELSNDG